MGIDSPITELIIEPFHKKLFNNKPQINNLAFGELSIVFIIFTLYYYRNGVINRSSLLYLISFILFYTFIKELKDTTLADILYFSINIILLLTIYNKNKFNPNTIIIITTLLSLTFISFCIKKSYEEKKLTNNYYINKWDNLVYNVSNSIYPEKLDKTKKYHLLAFWKFFDFSFFSLVIYILLNYEK